MSRKVILTCAVTGNAPFNPKHPCFPVTPVEIADAVIESAGAGASITHIHVRDPDTGGGSRDPDLFFEVVDRVRQSGTDIVINLTAGLGASTPLAVELGINVSTRLRGRPPARSGPGSHRSAIRLRSSSCL